ncbi:plasma membrane fusion protein PRM1 [Podospora appendiculata]|uniref:Plasma membrane fusion protein PRM1 n=1 Tax=Podospora appendiculata TaxID=314037 RepID=A0AAE0WYR4_9PEZI|nr:plasma membrane fusion protein PRM1 [Podospora appendiculata]
MSYYEKSREVPQVPSNLNPHAWEMADLGNQPPNGPQLTPHTDTNPAVTPYLGLRARLSQVWLNRWTILLLLVLFRVVVLTGTVNDNLDEAKAKALSACTKVEDVGSAMASMPHYLSVGVNSLAADGISSAVHGMVNILMMILTGVEALIVFIINMYVGTYACLIGAFIHGGLDVATHVVEGATQSMNEGISAVTGPLTTDFGDFQNALNGIIDKVNQGAGSIIKGAGISLPTIDITKYTKELGNIKFDDQQFVKDIVKLNQTLPTFAEAENFTKNAISIPFDLVKQKVNSSFGGYAFDKSVFPVAQKQALSFCSNNSFLNDFFTTLFELVAKTKIIFIVVIIILAIGSMFFFAYLEIRRWRRERQRARIFTEKGFDSMDVVYMASRPFTSGVGVKIAGWLRGTQRRYLWARWAVAYGTSLPALFVLSLAMAGFFSCLCQYLLLRSIQQQAPALATQVGDFANEVVGTLTEVSTNWSDSSNAVITKLQNDINDDVFGWVLNATTAVNDTLNTFDEEINKGITEVFNGTILMNTARDLINCLVTRKIESVEAGLTWVHDNAHVTLPLFPNDTFSQGASGSVKGDNDLTSFLATPSSVTTDEISSAVDHVVATLQNGIIQEALISTVLFFIYILVVLIGTIRALVGMAVQDKTRAEGGQRYLVNPPLQQHHRPPPPPPAAAASRQATVQDELEEESPAYEDVVYAGTVPRGKVSAASRYPPDHKRKSSHPELDH